MASALISDRAFDAIRLGQAIKGMADRYAAADREYSYAHGRFLEANRHGNEAQVAEADRDWRRWERTALRRRDALSRLVDALKRMVYEA